MQTDELKAQSEKIVNRLGLKVNPALPPLEEKAPLRAPAEIAKRILVLGYLYGISFNVRRSSIKKDLKKYGLYDDLSPREKKQLNSLFLSKQAKTSIDWVTEGIEVLGWSIGLWGDINPSELCNEDRQAAVVPLKQDPTEFILGARLIEAGFIYQQADLIYRLHWSAKREPMGALGKYSADVYAERHRAINWIIDAECGWDEVNTDT